MIYSAVFPRDNLDLSDWKAVLACVTLCYQPSLEATPQLMKFYELLCILQSYIGLDYSEITQDSLLLTSLKFVWKVMKLCLVEDVSFTVPVHWVWLMSCDSLCQKTAPELHPSTWATMTLLQTAGWCSVGLAVGQVTHLRVISHQVTLLSRQKWQTRRSIWWPGWANGPQCRGKRRGALVYRLLLASSQAHVGHGSC